MLRDCHCDIRRVMYQLQFWCDNLPKIKQKRVRSCRTSETAPVRQPPEIAIARPDKPAVNASSNAHLSFICASLGDGLNVRIERFRRAVLGLPPWCVANAPRAGSGGDGEENKDARVDMDVVESDSEEEAVLCDKRFDVEMVVSCGVVWCDVVCCNVMWCSVV